MPHRQNSKRPPRLSRTRLAWARTRRRAQPVLKGGAIRSNRKTDAPQRGDAFRLLERWIAATPLANRNVVARPAALTRHCKTSFHPSPGSKETIFAPTAVE